MKKIKDDRLIKGSGEFPMQINESGNFEFSITCESIGYTKFQESGKVKITILSQSEEISASILLTILTIILAAAFIAVRRWL